MALEIAKKIVSDRKGVPIPGTRVQLSSDSIEIFRIDVSADTNNTDVVLIGSSAVVAALGSQKGTVLFAGNKPITIYIDNVNKLWIDAITVNDAVTFTYYRHH